MRRLKSSMERERYFWISACLLLGTYNVLPVAGGQTSFLITCGLGLLVSAVGLSCRCLWAKYTTIFSASAFGLANVFRLGFTPAGLFPLAAIVISVPLLWMLGNSENADNFSDDDQDGEDALTSLVALLPEACYLDATILARLASQAWGVEVVVDEEGDAPFAVTGESPHFLVRAGERFFVVHSLDQPYFDDPSEFASHVLESRVSQAIRAHTAWISIDLLDVDEDAEDRLDNYRQISRLLAELIDDDCLAICCPENGTIHPYRPDFSEKLLADDPLNEICKETFPPVIHIDENDPRMQRAVETARETWPDFVQAFENRESDQTFSVKAPLCDSSGCEQIWLSVTAIEHDMIYGIVGNEPVRLTRYKLDDRARVPVKEISDWMFFEEGTLHGGYTIEVVSRVAAEHARKNPPEM